MATVSTVTKPAPLIATVQMQRESSDCGIAALACYLCVSYEDVLRAVTLSDRKYGREGLWTKTLVRVAARLGFRLVVRRTFDLHEDRGVLRMPQHAAVLFDGVVIDTDATVWAAEDYFDAKKLRVQDCLLLTVAA